jgi:hypothetical protein
MTASGTAGIPPFNPNAEINTANRTWEWEGKASGAYLLPADVMVSANLQILSGSPYARTALFTATGPIPSIVLNVQPIGSQSLPSIKQLDVRFEKRFGLGDARRVALRFNLYNALNVNTITAVNSRSGASYGLPMAIVPARILTFGASFDF